MKNVNVVNTLPGDYVSGLVDGEGCFILQYRREVKRNRPGLPIYFRWFVAFAIVLRKDDEPLLEMVKNTLGCGGITHTRNEVRYQVQDSKLLASKLIPFFERHPLFGKKHKDYLLWKEAVLLLVASKDKTLSTRPEEELSRLQKIRIAMKTYKAKGASYKWDRDIQTQEKP
ncbi:MAG: LAGLIDADG family homing endonuclease [Patescibacteria group bacterium]